MLSTSTSFVDDFRRYAATLWHWIWLLLLGSLTFGVVVYIFNKRAVPIYEATMRVLINEAPTNKATDYASVLTSERVAQTYAQLFITKPVMDAAIQEMGLGISPEALKSAIQVKPVRDTQLIEIRYEDPDPERAAQVLNTLFLVFNQQNQQLQENRFAESKASLEQQLTDLDGRIRQVSQELEDLGNSAQDEAARTRLETTLSQYRLTYSNLLLSYEQVRLTEAQSTSNLVQWEEAVPPTRPISPKVFQSTMWAMLAGLAVGIGLVFLLEALDDTLKGPDDATRQLGLPVLGIIARHQKGIRLITVAQPRSPVAEAYRSLRTNLQFASVDVPIHTLLVTSPSPADGKSTLTANLGLVLAQSGLDVAIIDADLRRPNLHQVLGLPNRDGLSSLFVDDGNVCDKLQRNKDISLSILTAGEVPPNPSELLGSARMESILRQISSLVDVVLIDTPPVMAVTDSAVLAPRVDGVILVVKPGVTNLAAARQAVDQLHRVGAKLLGVVLNEVDLTRSRYRYYRYRGYYYSYQNYYADSSSNGHRKNMPFQFPKLRLTRRSKERQ